MSFLVDSNIFLEGILLQERAEEARTFLSVCDSDLLHLSDFSLHSIGYILVYRQNHDAFREFVDDVIGRLGVRVLNLNPDDLIDVIAAAQQYTLDFDDAYQYTVAEKYDLTIVSYDRDFDRTLRGCVTPAMVLHRMRKQNDETQDNDVK